MKVTVAKSAGFCFGVERAVQKVEELVAEQRTPIYTYGPIIHNDEVIKKFEEKGVSVIYNEADLEKINHGYLVIRSHGIEKRVYQKIEGLGLQVIDATCPFVQKIHRYVEDYSNSGYDIVIVGNGEHPEVKGIKGWNLKTKTVVIDNENEAQKLPDQIGQKVCVVSQTTYNNKKFKDLVEIICKKGYDIVVLDTICNATNERQEEALEIASVSDAMIVIGDKKSSNTQKLFEICNKECNNTYYIQTIHDLDISELRSLDNVGITAGASTPKIIIEEVQKMSEMSFEQMLEGTLKTIRNGEVVEGTVIGVKPEEIILNIGYKSDGIITRNEYTNEPNVDLTTLIHVGDTMEAKVLKVNDGEGQVTLTYKRLAADKGNKRLEEAFNNHEVLTAKVAEVLSGGLSVIIDEARIFIPASLVSDGYEKDLTKYAGQEINFVITEFNPKRRRVIGDRRQLLMAKKEEMQKELFARIKVGDVVTGIVKNVTDFGVFIDLGGADGLLHISEMSWGRVESPKKAFKAGDEVTAFIKDINGNKIALSRKFEDENPWKDATTKYAVGNVVTGKVARMTDFGAFVELDNGVDALLHVSQIAKEHIDKPSDVLKIGQVVEAKIVDFNEEDKKISLSIKALLEPEAPVERPRQEEDADVADVDIEKVAKEL